MKHSVVVWGIVLMLTQITAFGVEYPVEPYSSKVKNEEMALVSQWIGFLTQNGQEADVARYSPEIPFGFRCGELSSREWVRVDNAKITTGSWSNFLKKFCDYPKKMSVAP